MVSIARLQAYLRHSAQQQYETVSVPFFTLFFHQFAVLLVRSRVFIKSLATVFLAGYRMPLGGRDKCCEGER